MSDPNNSRVYSAVYSSVPVYEMICRGVAVMRRSKDSWLNATQILKVAGIDKGRRTKILEREILGSEHEKVQGGYGKYQGTWVPYNRGIQLCQQYNVLEYLKPILEHAPRLSENGEDQTPTKAQLKQKMIHEQKNPFKRGILINNKKKKDFNNPAQMIPPAINPVGKRPREQAIDFNNDATPINNHLTSQHYAFNPQNFKYHPNSLSRQYFTSYDTPANQPKMPYKQADTVPNNTHYPPKPTNATTPTNGAASLSTPATAVTVVNQSPQHQEQLYSSEGLDHDKKLLISLFMSEDPSYIPDWLSNSKSTPGYNNDGPRSINVIIDDQGHTAVHWAAALARIEALDLLMLRGADARKLNYDGESALTKAVQVINNYESQVFPDLLELLHDGIPLTDKKNRSVLHHIVLTSKVEGRYQASIYYMECLLGWISRLSNGFVVESQSNSASGTPIHNPTPTPPSHFQNAAATSTSSNPNQFSVNLSSFDPTPIRNSEGQDSYGRFAGQSATSPLNPNNNLVGHSSTSTPRPRSQNQQYNSHTSTHMDPEFSISPINNTDFLFFLNLQDENGDTALNIAAQFNDRTLMQLLHSVGASLHIQNRAGIKPSDFWNPSSNTVSSSNSNSNPNSNSNKKSRKSLDSSEISRINRNTIDDDVYLHSSAPPSVHVRHRSHASDLFISPTKELNKYNPKYSNESAPHLLRAKLLDESSVDLKSSRNLSSNLEMVSKSSSRNHSSSLPNIGDILKKPSNLGKSSENSDDNLSFNNADRESDRLLSLSSIGSDQGKNILSVIRDLMDDLESEFKEQLLQKQEKHFSLMQQLKSTVNELSAARVTIEELTYKLNEMEKLASEKDSLTQALGTVTSTDSHTTCNDDTQRENAATTNDLPKDLPLLELKPIDHLIEIISNSLGALSQGLDKQDLGGLNIHDISERGTFELAKKYIASLKSKFSDQGSSHQVAGIIENFIDQLNLRNSQIISLASSVKSQHDLKHAQYKKVLSNLLALSEADLDLWVDKIVDTIDSKIQTGGEFDNSQFLASSFKNEIDDIVGKSNSDTPHSDTSTNTSVSVSVSVSASASAEARDFSLENKLSTITSNDTQDSGFSRTKYAARENISGDIESTKNTNALNGIHDMEMDITRNTDAMEKNMVSTVDQ